MNTDFYSIAIIFLLALTLANLVWGIRLWRAPSIYNPQAFFDRQLYLWYAAWFNRDVDESYQLDDAEIRKAGKLLVMIGVIVLLIALIFPFLLK